MAGGAPQEAAGGRAGGTVKTERGRNVINGSFHAREGIVRYKFPFTRPEPSLLRVFEFPVADYSGRTAAVFTPKRGIGNFNWHFTLLFRP